MGGINSDILCFSKANWESLLALKAILDDFASFPWLSFNATKSSHYLRVSIVGRSLRMCDCEILLGQLRRYLEYWKNRTLSYVGKIQLLGFDG